MYKLISVNNNDNKYRSDIGCDTYGVHFWIYKNDQQVKL